MRNFLGAQTDMDLDSRQGSNAEHVDGNGYNVGHKTLPQ